MKKFLLGIVFVLFSFVGYSQTVSHQDWKVENQGQWGSFYWGVTRTQYPNYQGLYFYYVYFYSNSYFNSKADGINYDKASTYISNVDVVMKTYTLDYYGKLIWRGNLLVELPYISCDWNYNPNIYGAWFSSPSPYNKFIITFDKAKAWDYSIY
jgi:hypothetical protein